MGKPFVAWEEGKIPTWGDVLIRSSSNAQGYRDVQITVDCLKSHNQCVIKFLRRPKVPSFHFLHFLWNTSGSKWIQTDSGSLSTEGRQMIWELLRTPDGHQGACMASGHDSILLGACQLDRVPHMKAATSS